MTADGWRNACGAPFIVLDEPTAASDPVSEHDIYTKFNSIVGTRTAVYISHRLSSCRFCDKITVLEEGRIVRLEESEDEMDVIKVVEKDERFLYSKNDRTII